MKLYISTLPANISDGDIVEVFENANIPVANVFINRWRLNAFLTVPDDCAARALRLDGTVIKGRAITVEPAMPRPVRYAA